MQASLSVFMDKSRLGKMGPSEGGAHSSIKHFAVRYLEATHLVTGRI